MRREKYISCEAAQRRRQRRNGLPFPAIVPVSRRQMSLFQESKLSDNLLYWLFLIGWVVLAAEMVSAFSSLRSRHIKYNKIIITTCTSILHTKQLNSQ